MLTSNSLSSTEVEETFYTTDVRKASLVELVRLTKGSFSGFLAAMVVKLFRIDLKPGLGFAFDRLEEYSADDLPEVTRHFEQEMIDLEKLGYLPVFGFKSPVLGNGSSRSMAFLGGAPGIYGYLSLSIAGRDGQLDVVSGVSFFSKVGGSMVATTNLEKRLNGPKLYQVTHLSGASVSELFQKHRSKLDAKNLLVFDKVSLRETVLECERVTQSDLIERGILRKLTHKEIEDCRTELPR